MTSFEKAFAAARKAGKKEFTWNGKRYHTRLKSETKKKSPPTPSPRPDRKKEEKKSTPTPSPRPTRLDRIAVSGSGSKEKGVPRPTPRPKTGEKKKKSETGNWKPALSIGPVRIGGNVKDYEEYRKSKKERDKNKGRSSGLSIADRIRGFFK